ncbi:MAG: 2'-5' RNA ligase family protein [Wujia sp.]
MYLISIYFDEDTNKTLQRYINRIAEKTGNTFMTDNRVPPHLTVCQFEARNVESLVPAMETLRGSIKKGQLQFVSVGMLLPYVLYVTPVLNEYLQGLEEKIYDTFKGIEETEINRFYKPMSWLPHVTLGKKLSKEEMLLAVEIMQGNFAPFYGMATELGLARVNPHEDVVRFKLL